jgi:rhamnosyltransferase
VRGDISVIVRARNEAPAIGRCLELVRDQETDGAVDLIVVDTASTDATVDIATRYGARVVSVPASRFSFGGALNLGAANARGSILVALSAHAFAPDRRWLARLMAPFSDPVVACASGDRFYPDGSALVTPVRQDLALAREHPLWGYSNAAGAFRAALWRQRPFRGDLPGSEDREWSRHWIERGYVCVVDPALVVDHDHTHDPVVSIYRRARREAEGFGMFLDLPPYGTGDLVREWWSDLRFYRSPVRARLSHRRAARMLGEYAGRRRARRRGR